MDTDVLRRGRALKASHPSMISVIYTSHGLHSECEQVREPLNLKS